MESIEVIENEEEVKTSYVIRLDDDGYWTGDYSENGDLIGNTVEVETLPDEVDRLKKLSYRLIDDALVFDEERYNALLAEQAVVRERANALAEIKSLEAEIKVLNDKLTECATYQTLGLEKPYVVADLLADKAVAQQRINELEESL